MRFLSYRHSWSIFLRSKTRNFCVQPARNCDQAKKSIECIRENNSIGNIARRWCTSARYARTHKIQLSPLSMRHIGHKKFTQHRVCRSNELTRSSQQARTTHAQVQNKCRTNAATNVAWWSPQRKRRRPEAIIDYKRYICMTKVVWWVWSWGGIWQNKTHPAVIVVVENLGWQWISVVLVSELAVFLHEFFVTLFARLCDIHNLIRYSFAFQDHLYPLLTFLNLI